MFVLTCFNKAGELGFELRFPASGSHRGDTGLTLKNQGSETTYGETAPVRNVVGLRSHGQCCCQFVAKSPNAQAHGEPPYGNSRRLVFSA